MIKETIFSTLVNDPGVAGLVGDRVYPVKMPQGVTLPAIGYTMIGGTRSTSLFGASGSGRFRVRIDSFDHTSDGAWQVFQASRDALDALLGALAAMNPVEFYDDDDESHRVSMDYYIYETEG